MHVSHYDALLQFSRFLYIAVKTMTVIAAYSESSEIKLPDESVESRQSGRTRVLTSNCLVCDSLPCTD